MGSKASILLQEQEVAEIQKDTGCKYVSWMYEFGFLVLSFSFSLSSNWSLFDRSKVNYVNICALYT